MCQHMCSVRQWALQQGAKYSQGRCSKISVCLLQCWWVPHACWWTIPFLRRHFRIFLSVYLSMGGKRLSIISLCLCQTVRDLSAAQTRTLMCILLIKTMSSMVSFRVCECIGAAVLTCVWSWALPNLHFCVQCVVCFGMLLPPLAPLTQNLVWLTSGMLPFFCILFLLLFWQWLC